MSKGSGEREVPSPEGGEVNGKLRHNAYDEDEQQQQTRELVGRPHDELRNRQPRGGVRGVEKPGGDAAVAYLKWFKMTECVNVGITSDHTK